MDLWVSMGFILVLHWHYKYVVTVCYEKHGLNKLEKLWRKVIALNIGLIREQARRWDHSWMELSDFDMFYNIQNPSKLDNVLFCVFWMLFLKPSYFLFGFWHSYSRRNVLQQSAGFFIIYWACLFVKDQNLPSKLMTAPWVVPRALRVIVHKEKASLCLGANLGESRRFRHQNQCKTGQLRQQTKTAINNKLIIEL